MVQKTRNERLNEVLKSFPFFGIQMFERQQVAYK